MSDMRSTFIAAVGSSRGIDVFMEEVNDHIVERETLGWWVRDVQFLEARDLEEGYAFRTAYITYGVPYEEEEG